MDRNGPSIERPIQHLAEFAQLARFFCFGISWYHLMIWWSKLGITCFSNRWLFDSGRSLRPRHHPVHVYRPRLSCHAATFCVGLCTGNRSTLETPVWRSCKRSKMISSIEALLQWKYVGVGSAIPHPWQASFELAWRHRDHWMVVLFPSEFFVQVPTIFFASSSSCRLRACCNCCWFSGHNCIHFCSELALALGVSPVPVLRACHSRFFLSRCCNLSNATFNQAWVRNLHETGALTLKSPDGADRAAQSCSGAGVFQLPWPLSALHSTVFGDNRKAIGCDLDATANVIFFCNSYFDLSCIQHLFLLCAETDGLA